MVLVLWSLWSMVLVLWSLWSIVLVLWSLWSIVVILWSKVLVLWSLWSIVVVLWSKVVVLWSIELVLCSSVMVLWSLCSRVLVLWSIELLLWSNVLALSRRLVVLLRIRTGMEELDWDAIVKCAVLKESSKKHKWCINKDLTHPASACSPSDYFLSNMQVCKAAVPLLSNTEDFFGPDGLFSSFTFLKHRNGKKRS